MKNPTGVPPYAMNVFAWMSYVTNSTKLYHPMVSIQPFRLRNSGGDD